MHNIDKPDTSFVIEVQQGQCVPVAFIERWKRARELTAACVSACLERNMLVPSREGKRETDPLALHIFKEGMESRWEGVVVQWPEDVAAGVRAWLDEPQKPGVTALPPQALRALLDQARACQ